MYELFYGASSFNQDLCAWSDKSEGLALFEGRLGEPTLPETMTGTTKAPPAATTPGSEEQSSTTSTTSTAAVPQLYLLTPAQLILPQAT